MNLPAILLVIMFFAVQGIGTGIPLQPGPSLTNKAGGCCTSMASCSSGQNSMASGIGHCSCSQPSQPMVPCTGPCAKNSHLAQIQGTSDRVRECIIRGYRRISRKNILEHEARRDMYSMICRHPGQDSRNLAAMCGLNEHTAKYHLDRITAAGYVTLCTSGGVNHYFENHGTYTEREQTLISRLRNGTPGKILNEVVQSPGISRGELAERLGVSGPVITRSVQALVEEGLIHDVQDGKYRRYYPGWGSLAFTPEPRIHPA